MDGMGGSNSTIATANTFGVNFLGGECCKSDVAPHHVAFVENNRDFERSCSGALIDESYILTAGHCVNNL